MSTDQTAGQAVLEALLERLYSALARGPAINCYPGNSRQRVDLNRLSILEEEISASEILKRVLSDEEKIKLSPKVESIDLPEEDDDSPEAKELRARKRAQEDRLKMLRKLSRIASDADMFQRDTGNYVLYIGYPLLSLVDTGAGTRSGPKKILSPLAFIPVGLSVSTGARPSLTIQCIESGADRVIPNAALKIWIERQLGTPYPELFEDEEGKDPIREIQELTDHVRESLKISNEINISELNVERVPNSSDLPGEPTLMNCAVLGLFHLKNQATIQNMEDMIEANTLPPTVSPFVTLSSKLVTEEDQAYSGELEVDRTELLTPEDEHLVDLADPCQRRAVIRSRTARGLVIHGPPGTGKSQTITNIIGDYLARGKRVLLVCEKITALDVVRYRLDARGLGDLCAVVHDPTRDRTSLYKGVRERLENLSDAPDPEDVSRELQRVNNEIARIDGELQSYYNELGIVEEKSGLTLHELVGGWLDTGGHISTINGLEQVGPEDVLAREGEIKTLYQRLEACNYNDNGWNGRCGMPLDKFLSSNMSELRRLMDEAVSAAQSAAQVGETNLPPWRMDVPISQQAEAYREAATKLKDVTGNVKPEIAAALAKQSVQERQQVQNILGEVRQQSPFGPQAQDIALPYNTAPWPFPQLAAALPVLMEYLEKGQGFLSIFRFGLKKRATETLKPLGLSLSKENAEKAHLFLSQEFAKAQLRVYLGRVITTVQFENMSSAQLHESFDSVVKIVDLLNWVSNSASNLASSITTGLQDYDELRSLATQLEAAAGSAAQIEKCLNSIDQTGLFNQAGRDALAGKLLEGGAIDADLQKLREDLENLEPLLRFEHESASFAPAVSESLRTSATNDADAELAWNQLISAIYYSTAQEFLRAHSQLQSIDGDRLEGNFTRLRELTKSKQQLEVKSIARYWLTLQKQRLLAGTGSRLNSTGADLRRRLTLRGKNASRLREVVHSGMSIEGGDPLFDMCPVWMTSPETACMIFPLQPVFDAVVFDEASQCRLEEGLSVLARGNTVIIAGDTKQLPPTSFFQSAVVSSIDALETEDTEEELFQSSQAEIEDLLSAALNIEIDQAYLDVHYRSSSPDLIQFSNQSFYNSRLQAIPGHPNRRRHDAAIQLHRCEGILEDSQNIVEADYVVNLVKGLLRREDPPSIGIATFNLTQKDLIEEKLDAAAEEDPEFRTALAESRARMGRGSFEGLFVKNLENVQGDERDYIIISTTFAPRPNGKFYRNFGPLSKAGGERRLNVIVTRARHQVDIVTSIPSEIYRGDAGKAIPEGQRPNGAWYLMNYLVLAEQLEDEYEQARARDAALEAEETETIDSGALIDPWPTVSPSRLVDSVAKRLASQHKVPAMVYYGAEGFAMDLSIKEKVKREKVTTGILLDQTRYPRVQNKVEWDVYRRGIFDFLGWQYKTIWSPHFLRDPGGTLKKLSDLSVDEEVLSEEKE